MQYDSESKPNFPPKAGNVRFTTELRCKKAYDKQDGLESPSHSSGLLKPHLETRQGGKFIGWEKSIFQDPSAERKDLEPKWFRHKSLSRATKKNWQWNLTCYVKVS